MRYIGYEIRLKHLCGVKSIHHLIEVGIHNLNVFNAAVLAVTVYMYTEITGCDLLHGVAHFVDGVKKHAGDDNGDNSGDGESQQYDDNKRKSVAHCHIIMRDNLDGYP